MSDYETVNGLTRPAASEQDKLIASVELAGYRLVCVKLPHFTHYTVTAPTGDIVGVRPTRYGAALLAERHIYGDV